MQELQQRLLIRIELFERLAFDARNKRPYHRFEGLSKRKDNSGKSKVFWRDEPAAHAALTIGEIGSPLSRSSTQDESQTNVTPIDVTDRIGHALTVSATDRVQHALDVVAALEGGSRLADLSPTAPPAEARDSGAGALNGLASAETTQRENGESQRENGSDLSKRLKSQKRNAKTE
jgi:hypothetical protein